MLVDTTALAIAQGVKEPSSSHLHLYRLLLRAKTSSLSLRSLQFPIRLLGVDLGKLEKQLSEKLCPTSNSKVLSPGLKYAYSSAACKYEDSIPSLVW